MVFVFHSVYPFPEIFTKFKNLPELFPKVGILYGYNKNIALYIK